MVIPLLRHIGVGQKTTRVGGVGYEHTQTTDNHVCHWARRIGVTHLGSTDTTVGGII